MSELEFLSALHVDLVRRKSSFATGAHHHELFQTSTVAALLGGAFDGDVTLAEVLEHGDLGLGTLDGLDGELIVIDGRAWKAKLDCTVVPASGAASTPYAVVVPFSATRTVHSPGPLSDSELDGRVGHPARATAIRIDGRFSAVRVRSVPKQKRPYPPLAAVIAHEHISELVEVTGTMVGFCFPDALDGIEMVGWHLHFITDDRTRGGHVLSYAALEATAQLDEVTELHVELPPQVELERGSGLDQEALRRLETDG